MPKELILKQYDSETKAVEGERALNVTITTNDMDRDGDIVEPKGAKLANYRKNPVVLMAHDYKGLPIAKAKDLAKTDSGINAKVVFPEEGIYPLADTVYNMYKHKFMKAWSIGFIPIKSEDIADDEDEDGKVAERGMRRGKRIKSWELLEFSACSVPSNPNALSNMMEKGINIDTLKEAGFIEIEDEEEKDLLNDDNEKIEETEEYIRIPAKGEEGKHKGHKIRWITVSEKEGIRGIYCIDCKKIITFVFDKKKGWTLEKAKKWMEDHGKDIEDIEEKQLEIEIEEKGVIPFKETPKAPEDEDWDAGKEVKQAEISDLKIMCAWFDSENPDVKGAYKLPHHKAKGHTVVWRGVAAAMAALLGARGGVAIPAGDKKGVYNHLKSHYKQFDKEPPELRDYEDDEIKYINSHINNEKIDFDLILDMAEFGQDWVDTIRILRNLENVTELTAVESKTAEEIYEIVKENKELKEKIKEIELKAGAVLNAKNKQNLKQAQNLIQEVLDSAESAQEDSLEIEDEKNIKEDNTVIDLEDDKKDDEPKDKEEDEDTIEVDEETIAKAIDERMGYILGKVKKQSDTKNKIERS